MSLGNTKQNNLFAKYAGRKDDEVDGARIGPNGVMKLLEDLGYSPEDRQVLILCALTNAQTQCEFSHEEFVGFLSTKNIDTLANIKKFVDNFNRKMDTDESAFQEVYKFTFNYALIAGNKNLDIGSAITYWNILVTKNYKLFSVFMKFLQEGKSKPRGITRDVWNMFPEFLRTTKDIKDYDEMASWPSAFDDFVEFASEL